MEADPRPQDPRGGRLEEFPEIGVVRPRPSRVVIVEGQRLFADAVRSSLEQLGLSVLPVANDGWEALQLLRHGAPDLVILDLALVGTDPFDLGRKIVELRPLTRVVALHERRDPDAEASAALMGFHGYVTKDMTIAAFVRSVLDVLDGRVVFPSRTGGHEGSGNSVPSSLVENGNGHHATGSAPLKESARAQSRQLTHREQEVLSLLVQGLSGDEISRRLFLSRHTVRTHIQSILTKLQAHSRLEAVAFALRHGLVSMTDERS